MSFNSLFQISLLWGFGSTPFWTNYITHPVGSHKSKILSHTGGQWSCLVVTIIDPVTYSHIVLPIAAIRVKHNQFIHQTKVHKFNKESLIQ